MSTSSILSILAYPQYGYHLVYYTGLSLVHCSYLSVGSLQEYNLVVHAEPDITMHRLSLGMRVKELPTICIGIIAIVAAPATWINVRFIGHIILSSGELQGTQSPTVEIFPPKWGFGIVKVQVWLWT